MGRLRGYHIHVYFNKATESEQVAHDLCEKAKADWGEKPVGKFHLDPIGPHLTGSFQIWVNPEQRDFAIDWTTQNRNGLRAMMHKVSDDGHHHDHTEAVTWYGDLGPDIIDVSIFEPNT